MHSNSFKKGGTSVTLCRTSVNNGSVETWHNNGYVPQVVDSTDRQLGLSNARVSSMSGMLMCSFTRANTVSNGNYYNVNNASTPYFIVAYGSGDISFHGNNEGESSSTVSLSGSGTPTNPTKNPILAFLSQLLSTIIYYIKALFGL